MKVHVHVYGSRRVYKKRRYLAIGDATQYSYNSGHYWSGGMFIGRNVAVPQVEFPLYMYMGAILIFSKSGRNPLKSVLWIAPSINSPEQTRNLVDLLNIENPFFEEMVRYILSNFSLS